jgi:glucokinase-like ROK family protein
MPYFPQSAPEMGHLRHLLLLYGDAQRPWTEEELLYSVAHVDREGRPDDWLFDSFLFLNVRAGSGRDYRADVNLGTSMCGEGDFFAACSPQPATKADWMELLDFYLGPSGAVRTLERTLASALHRIGRPYGEPRNVVLMIPYPHITQPAWGALDAGGTSLDFTIRSQNLMRASEQRLAACRFFVDEIVGRWSAQRFEHVRLLGVYWMFETVHRGWDVDDHWLLKELRPHVNRHGLKLLWIPFWSSYNVHALDDYRSYYFDLAFLQPNYMFYREGKSIEAAARAARARGAGIEIEYYLELDEPIRVEGERHSRFREYLNGGIRHGYMRDAACAHFQGVGALRRMHGHADPMEREMYEDLYRFVRGDYELKPAIPRAPDSDAPTRAALAIDLGGTNLRAAIVDEAGRLHAREAVPTPRGREAIIDALLGLAERMRDEARRLGIDLVGIGVSTGGRVNAERGVIVDSTALLEGWRDVPLAEALERRLGLRTRVDNDGNCAALAEQRFGLGLGLRHFVTVVVGTGVGGGIVIEGQLLRGASHAGAEIGHVTIDPRGATCSCGGRGCIELLASGSGIAARARELARRGDGGFGALGPEQLTAEAVGRAALAGDATARGLVEDAGRALGHALGGLVNVLNPERVILSGSVLRTGDLYLRSLREAMETSAMKTAREAVDVVVSALEEPGLLGAAALALG